MDTYQIIGTPTRRVADLGDVWHPVVLTPPADLKPVELGEQRKRLESLYAERASEPVLDLTHGMGANAIYEPVGGDVFMQSLRCIAPEGRICPIGFASGTIPQIPANILLVKNITVCGLNLGYYFGWSPIDVRYQYMDRLGRDVKQLCQWYQEGRISLATSHAFPLEQFQDAMQVVLERRSLGRVVVLPNGDG
jgi:NADPH2:quinone reductase